MKNQVIEVLNKEHGKKVIEYWESKGFNVRGFTGNQTKEDDSEFRFYGVINGEFNNYYQKAIDLYEAEIIHLPTESPKDEKPFPRVMLVSDDGDSWHKRVVFMKRCNRYLSWLKAETIEESEGVYEATAWRYAKELPEKVELTKSEIAEKFGISIEQLVIKDD